MTGTLSLAGLDVAWGTDAGRVREGNEDAVGVVGLPGGIGVLLVVADGMGGHAGGEVAGRIVCERMLQAGGELGQQQEAVEWFDALLEAAYDADRLVRAEAERDLRLTGMGSTVVAAAVTPSRALHLHVGDSRLYHFRDGSLLYRTQDHSVVEMLRQMGQITESEMRDHPSRSMLLASLGGGSPEAQLDAAPKWQEGAGRQEAELVLEAGDLLLLCTDGLNGMLGEEGLADAIADAEGCSAAERVERLIEAALQAGGEDNVTAAIVRVGRSEAAKPAIQETGALEG